MPQGTSWSIGRRADGAAADLRQAVRALARAPIYTVTAILTLALGIGATTAAYTVVRNAAALVAAGLVIGVAGAVGLAHAMRSLLFGVTPLDPTTFVGVGLLLV